VSRYTKAAEQRKLAQAAMDRLRAQDPVTDSQTYPGGLGFIPKNLNATGEVTEGWWSRGESNP
jgi:hypothetical protein